MKYLRGIETGAGRPAVRGDLKGITNRFLGIEPFTTEKWMRPDDGRPAPEPSRLSGWKVRWLHLRSIWPYL